MATVLHVNQHVIRANLKRGESNPPLTIRWGSKTTTRCREAMIFGQDGLPAARLIYSPEKPLSCGARVWIELLDAASVTATA